MTLLTTNLDTSIDPALKRRLGAHIVFWPPDEEERARLWQRMIPPEAPVDGELDFVVDPDGTTMECHEDNNTLVVLDGLCP